MNGGNVNSNAPSSIRNVDTLTRTRFTSRDPQRRASTNHATSQTAIALSDTPDKVPVGVQKMNPRRIAGTASPAKAKMPRARDPTPAARIAAAPGPLGSDPGCADTGRAGCGPGADEEGRISMLLVLKQNDCLPTPHRCVSVQEGTKAAGHGGREEGHGGEGQHRVPHVAMQGKLRSIFDEHIGDHGHRDGG